MPHCVNLTGCPSVHRYLSASVSQVLTDITGVYNDIWPLRCPEDESHYTNLNQPQIHNPLPSPSQILGL
ncbi:hypothetical protein I79_003414 [Cricetulus griseus]|uniref:Uncharacterized protein n=1 Tax=Cricetulus griseus TaxID=10029 RepID=G3GZW6_CRIGR|nr:hypothetical protein I79_003414 [Cricetulus griseus]